MPGSPPGTLAVVINKLSFQCKHVQVEWDYIAHLVVRWSSDTTLPNWEPPCKLAYTVSTLISCFVTKGKCGFLIRGSCRAFAVELNTSALSTWNCEVTGKRTMYEMLLIDAGLFGNSKCMLCFECL